jgi:hypothetical protein
MKRHESVYFLIGMAVIALFVAFAWGSDGTLSTLAQSPIPTWTYTPTLTPAPASPTSTYTPIPPTPTDTPVPPTSTDTPVPPTPTNTPVPPTPTDTPVPPTPTNTPVPLTPTNTPVPPTPTDTPVPPTPTDTPVPPTPTPTDTKPPVSRVRRLKRVRFNPSFKVRWKGHDRGGSGIKCYDVQYKDGTGSWQDWETCTTATSAKFHGERGHRYFFRARARDNAGNVEAWPSKPDAWTYVRTWKSKG